MFPGGDMSTMLAQAQALQQQLAQAQDELARTRVDGSASGGLVTATVTGAGELLGLVISPAALAGDDPAETAETVADLVLAAVRDATSNAAALAERAMAPLTENLGGLSSQLGGGGPALPAER